MSPLRNFFLILSIILPLSFLGCASVGQEDFAYLAITAHNVDPEKTQPEWIAFYSPHLQSGVHIRAATPFSKILAGSYVFSHIDFHRNINTSEFTSSSKRLFPTHFILKPGHIYFVGAMELTPKAGGLRSGYDMVLTRDESMLRDICEELPDLSVEYPFHLININERGIWKIQPNEESSYLECS